MSGPDENAERAEDKTNDVGANPRESVHSTPACRRSATPRTSRQAERQRVRIRNCQRRVRGPKRNRRYVYCSLTSLASIMPAAIGAPPPYGKSTPLLWTVHRR